MGITSVSTAHQQHCQAGSERQRAGEALQRWGKSRLAGWLCRLWQFHNPGRARSRRTGRRNGAVVGTDNLLHHVQPKPAVVGFGGIKGRTQLGELVLGNASPSVPDLKTSLTAFTLTGENQSAALGHSRNAMLH